MEPDITIVFRRRTHRRVENYPVHRVDGRAEGCSLCPKSGRCDFTCNHPSDAGETQGVIHNPDADYGKTRALHCWNGCVGETKRSNHDIEDEADDAAVDNEGSAPGPLNDIKGEDECANIDAATRQRWRTSVLTR